MFKFSKKKTCIGLLGIIISICLVALFGCLSPSGNITELNVFGVIFRILSLLFVASAIGFIFYIFSDIKGFLLVFGLFVVFIIFRVLIEFTSKSSPIITLFIISLIGIVFLVATSYNQYKSNNFAINGNKALSNKEMKEQEKFYNEINALIKEDDEFKNSIGYLKNSIIIVTQYVGTMYQVIKINDGFLFHYIGNILKGIDQSKVIKDFINIEQDIVNKKDYILKFVEIDKITANIKSNYNIMDYGNLKVTLKNGKNKKYLLINLFEENELKIFFGDKINVIKQVKNIEANEVQEICDEEKLKMNKLNKFFFIFSIISSVIFGIYFCFYNKIAQAILTFLCIIICIIPFVIYILFPKYISLKDKSSYGLNVQNGKLNIIQNVLIFPTLFALISIIDGYLFAYYNVIKLLIYSVILFVVFTSVILIFSKEYRKEKSALFVIILVCFILSPAIVHKIDFAYDFSPSQEIYCEITDNPTWTNNNNEITYYLTFKYDNKDIKTEVSKEIYENYNIGDKILVLKKQGALGIEKLIING